MQVTGEPVDSELGTRAGWILCRDAVQQFAGEAVSVLSDRAIKRHVGVIITGSTSPDRGDSALERGSAAGRIISETAYGARGHQRQMGKRRQEPAQGPLDSTDRPLRLTRRRRCGLGTPVLPARSHHHLPVWDSRRLRPMER